MLKGAHFDDDDTTNQMRAIETNLEHRQRSADAKGFEILGYIIMAVLGCVKACCWCC
jgi:hypothetical protein